MNRKIWTVATIALLICVIGGAFCLPSFASNFEIKDSGWYQLETPFMLLGGLRSTATFSSRFKTQDGLWWDSIEYEVVAPDRVDVYYHPEGQGTTPVKVFSSGVWRWSNYDLIYLYEGCDIISNDQPLDEWIANMTFVGEVFYPDIRVNFFVPTVYVDAETGQNVFGYNDPIESFIFDKSASYENGHIIIEIVIEESKQSSGVIQQDVTIAIYSSDLPWIYDEYALTFQGGARWVGISRSGNYDDISYFDQTDYYEWRVTYDVNAHYGSVVNIYGVSLRYAQQDVQIPTLKPPRDPVYHDWVGVSAESRNFMTALWDALPVFLTSTALLAPALALFAFWLYQR